MADLYARPLPDDMNWTLDSLKTGTRDVLGATWDETVSGNITPLVDRWIERSLEEAPTFGYTTEIGEDGKPRTVGVPNPSYLPSTMLDPADANKQYGIKMNGQTVLGWTEPVSERQAQKLRDLKMDELRRQDVINRGNGGFWQGAARLGTGLGASVVDPLNLLSAFIPVVGEARYATLLAEAGAGLLSRAGVRAGVGAVEGAVGQALLEPFVYGLSKAEQRDYNMADSLINIAFGGAFGAGLHIPVGMAKDRLFGIPKLIEDSPIETKRAMLGDALTSVMEDRPVRADLALREHLLGGTSNSTALDMARFQFETRMGPFSPDPVQRDMGGGLRGAPDTPHPLPDRTGSSVPVLARNGEAMSFTTMKRAENAVRRLARDENIETTIVETPNGFMLRRESEMEPLRKTDGSIMLFDTDRAARRYADTNTSLKGLDPTGDRKFDVIPYSDGGPVRFALVEGASEGDIAAARKAPDRVELRASRDVGASVDEEARNIQTQRSNFESEVNAWLDSRRNPTVRASDTDLRVYTEYRDTVAQAMSERESIRLDGGRTEQTIIERELADLDAQIKAIEDVGELPEGARAELDQADAAIRAAEQRASMYERIAACVRSA